MRTMKTVFDIWFNCNKIYYISQYSRTFRTLLCTGLVIIRNHQMATTLSNLSRLRPSRGPESATALSASRARVSCRNHGGSFTNDAGQKSADELEQVPPRIGRLLINKKGGAASVQPVR